MLLAESLKKSKQSMAQFAQKAGICKQTIQNLKKGYYCPSYRVALKIEEASNNIVSTEELLENWEKCKGKKEVKKIKK